MVFAAKTLFSAADSIILAPEISFSIRENELTKT
jgi:hypothetical protein